MRIFDWLHQAVEDLPAPTGGGHDWVWLIGLLVVTAPGIFGAYWARQAKAESKTTNRQVVNDHVDEPVLRVDIDGKHAELMGEVSGLRGEVSGLRAVLTEHGNRMGSIEQHLRIK